MNEDTKFSRRESLLAAGGLIAAALIPEAAAAGRVGAGGGRVRCDLVRADAGADGGPVLRAGREGAPQHHRGQAGHAARPSTDSRRRLDVQADQERGRRHLARGRARRLLGRSRRQSRHELHARHPEDGQRRACALPIGLSRLVSGPRRAHPREGASRRHRRAHGSVLLQGRADRRGVQAVAVQLAGEPGHAERRRLDLPERRQPLDAEGDEARHRIPRRDHHGRPPRLTRGGD